MAVFKAAGVDVCASRELTIRSMIDSNITGFIYFTCVLQPEMTNGMLRGNVIRNTKDEISMVKGGNLFHLDVINYLISEQSVWRVFRQSFEMHAM